MVNTKRTLQTKLFAGFVLVTLFAIAVPAFLLRSALYENYLNHVTEHSFEQTAIIKSVLESDPTPEQIQALLSSSLQNGNRLTIIDSTGVTLYDSHIEGKALREMDNHNDRPEVEEARAKGRGVSTRYSNTLGLDSVYTAVAFGNDKIMRLALPLADVHLSFATHLSTLTLIFAIATIICLGMSIFITQRVRKDVDTMAEVVADIANNKGGRRLTRVPGKEFLPLAHAVNHMAENIENYVATTTDQRTQLEIILDSVHEGILVLSPSGAIRRYNKALAELFPGVLTARDRQVIEAIPVPDLQHKVEEFLACTAYEKGHAEKEAGAIHEERHATSQGTGEEANHGAKVPEYDCAQRNAQPLHFEYAGKFLVTHLSQPVQSRHGNQSVGAVLVIYNATTIMHLERVRRDFIANISHELRTPLTAISGYAETLLSMDDLTEEQKQFTAIIYKHANSLARVIHDLLALTRIEKADDSIALEPISPALPCQEAMKICAELAAQKNLRFEVSIPGSPGTPGTPDILDTPGTPKASGTPGIMDIMGISGTPDAMDAPNAVDFIGSQILDTPTIMGNAAMLTQVFRNLLENACRYSPVGGTIAISAHVEGKEMVFAVKDQGPGIARNELSQIFERLYQVNKERNSGSSGIGLAICKHIIRLHKGIIWAESPYERYATAMLFTLPLAEKSEQEVSFIRK